MTELQQERFSGKVDRLDNSLREFYYRLSSQDQEYIFEYYKGLKERNKIGDLSAVELSVALGRFIFRAKLEAMIQKIPRKNWAEFRDITDWIN